MRLLIYIAIVGLGLSLSGCGSAKPTLTTNTTETVTDSTVTTIRVVTRDTIITVPQDSVIVSVPLVDLTEDPIVKESTSGTVKAKVRIVNKIIEVECLVDALELKIKLQDKEIERLREINTQKKVVQVTTVPVKYVPWYIKIFAWFGLASAILGIIKLVIKYIKPF